MSLKGYYLLPHPPIVLPEVGKGEEKKISATNSSLHKVGKEIAANSPSTIIIITPHGTMFQDALNLSYEDEIYGDLTSFGINNVSMKLPINKTLTKKIYELAQDAEIPAQITTNSFLNEYNTSVFLDHGALVPLYFINKYYQDYRLVHITYAPLKDPELYKFGMLIKKAVELLNENTVLIASGDLSHRLKAKGPYEYSPMGEKFDTLLLKHLEQGDLSGFFSMDQEMIREAGECGRRSIAILLGALEGKEFKGELLSYEGTFGVGYGVMKLQQFDPYVRLARESLTAYLTTGKKLAKFPDYISEEMKNIKRGVFVSLKKQDELRGCIGTIFPQTNNVAEEIIANAIAAGIHDPRFPKVHKEELGSIDFSVDVLTEPKPTSKEELDPKKYGVIVRSKGRTGLLLPDLEGVNTVQEQLSIALRKAGIGPHEEYEIEKFKVIRHTED